MDDSLSVFCGLGRFALCTMGEPPRCPDLRELVASTPDAVWVDEVHAAMLVASRGHDVALVSAVHHFGREPFTAIAAARTSIGRGGESLVGFTAVREADTLHVWLRFARAKRTPLDRDAVRGGSDGIARGWSPFATAVSSLSTRRLDGAPRCPLAAARIGIAPLLAGIPDADLADSLRRRLVGDVRWSPDDPHRDPLDVFDDHADAWRGRPATPSLAPFVERYDSRSFDEAERIGARLRVPPRELLDHAAGTS